MAKSSKTLFFMCLVFVLFFSAMSQTCTLNTTNKKSFNACQDLSVLSSTVYWNYYPSNGTVEVAFKQTVIGGSRWVAWAINPTSTGMLGSQAIVAYRRTDGTMSVYSSPIKSYGTQLEPGNLSFPLYDVSAVYENNQIIIFATVGLPNNASVVNHVWQEGPLSGNTPRMHSISGPNVQSFGTLDFLSGKIETSKGAGTSTSALKTTHAILNTISWGLLMPIGAIVARHLKGFKSADPAWFHVHRACQMLAYVGGVAGFFTGLSLGAKSSGIEYKGHRCIGFSLIILATFQVAVAFLLRPNKTQEKKRFFWNWLHYGVGYTTITLGVMNILKGFDILDPKKEWKVAYIAAIIILGVIAVILEVLKWVLVLRRKRTDQAAAEQDQTIGTA